MPRRSPAGRRRAERSQTRDYGSASQLIDQSTVWKVSYTYILQSETDPERYYIGSTEDLRQRLKEHNAGKCAHTRKYGPWAIKSYFAFEKKETAREFERYLKTGSGRMFAKRHFD